MAAILIINGTIVTLGEDNEILRGHSILIKDGRIEKIAKEEELLPEDEIDVTLIDAHGKIVMPGFINAHMHYYSSFARGLSQVAPSKDFSSVLENLWWRLDKKLTLEDCYYSAMVANVEAIRHGTTTIFDHHASPGAVSGSLNKIAEAVMDSGIRASLCYELSNRDGEKIAKEGIAENIDFIKSCNRSSSPLIKGMFGMHASFTISDKSLNEAVGLVGDQDVGFHLHCAEDQVDQAETEKKYGMRVVERLNKANILGNRTILAHGVHLNDLELELIKKNGSIVVHNPQSNMNNAVGVADIIKMSELGILIGLGTDAMTVNMLEELRSALWLQKLSKKNPSVGFEECVNALIANNPKIANRFWRGLGEIIEGNVADIIVVDYVSPTEFDRLTFLGHLVFGISQATVDTTIVNGEVLMHNKQLVTIDEREDNGPIKRARKLSLDQVLRYSN